MVWKEPLRLPLEHGTLLRCFRGRPGPLKCGYLVVERQERYRAHVRLASVNTNRLSSKPYIYQSPGRRDSKVGSED